MYEPGISTGQQNPKIDEEVAPHSSDTVNSPSLLLCFIKTIRIVYIERVRTRIQGMLGLFAHLW